MREKTTNSSPGFIAKLVDLLKIIFIPRYKRCDYCKDTHDNWYFYADGGGAFICGNCCPDCEKRYPKVT